MDLINLEIDRIIIHQVYQRDLDSKAIPPLQSHEYTRFDKTAMTTFKTRVREALGRDSKAVKMDIVNQANNDMASIVNRMIEQDDATFAASSYDIALKLTEAQKARSIPGGIVVIFTGRQGHPHRKFLGIIKAEIHSAYEKEVNETTKEISLKFVEEVLLTPATKLYKTAGFFEKNEYEAQCEDLNEKWSVLVSDSQINQTDGKAAAQYFYSRFLGCGYPKTSARDTKNFYDATCSFIKKLNIDPIQRNDLLNALITYLKVEKSSTISASEFSLRFFSDVDTRDEFSIHMEKQGVPSTDITKDITHIESNLRFRKISFGGNVKILAPAEAFKALVSIEPIEGDIDEYGMHAEWTKVIIKDKVIQQE